MRWGKKERPTTTARWAAGRLDRTCAGRRWARGLYPRKAANRVDTGRQVAYLFGYWPRDAFGDKAVSEARRERARQAHDHQGEEDPDREHLGGVLEGGVHAGTGPPVLGGRLFITPARLGLANAPMARPFINSKRANVQ